ncbi:hypothetical protein IE53DRAFT_315273 [Violaceomyces palustris]|uniref:Uncharacterized protein n=1 Tax=Violaceomyces palustris TaxID=1673888 RepID=A0ACD0NY50_9BASI|nr:hypothetical protein IE53DRAFT_315273 [Violaceomyces palustris]
MSHSGEGVGDPQPLTKQEILCFKNSLADSIRDQHWYTILTAATASAHAGAEAVPLIYEIASEDFKGRQGDEVDREVVRIQRRIKESLLKGSVLFGIPAALDSVFSLLPLLRNDARSNPNRSDSGFFQRKGQTIDSVTERGMDQLGVIYRHNLTSILEEKMGSEMEDLKCLTLNINYGWILSENSVLDLPSTELVILSALVPQNVRSEILWHLRGCRRVGWNDREIESVRSTCLSVAKRLACRTNKVPSLDQVSEDSNE